MCFCTPSIRTPFCSKCNVHMFERIGELRAEVERLQEQLKAYQSLLDASHKLHEIKDRREDKLKAEIDRLMLEFCPEEMTPEQVAEWARNKKPVEES